MVQSVQVNQSVCSLWSPFSHSALPTVTAKINVLLNSRRQLLLSRFNHSCNILKSRLIKDIEYNGRQAAVIAESLFYLANSHPFNSFEI